MTGTTKKAVRLAGVALIAAMAAGSAARAEGTSQFVVAAYESTFVAAVSLDGCAPSPAARTCGTTLRAVSGTAAGLPCESSAAYVDGTHRSGICSVGWGTRAGTARVTVANSGCETVVLRDPRQARLTLVDGMGTTWRVTDFRLEAMHYVHEGLLDNWNLRAVAGVTTVEGSWVRAVNGSRTLVAWINGTMSSVGWCFADAGSASFTVTGAAQGWVIQ